MNARLFGGVPKSQISFYPYRRSWALSYSSFVRKLILGVYTSVEHSRAVPFFMSALEKHYSAIEIAGLWALSPETIRRLFEHEPGVLRISEPSSRLGRKLKRSYHTLRIPESVVIRVHQRLTRRS